MEHLTLTRKLNKLAFGLILASSAIAATILFKSI